ncbi:MAG TPA: FMN-binding glutamate synthase family protein [Gammaproteobacteria bacterium]|nr:FMN-binding glutamate synthase family protein [Gammaproteobacteria bacterium]
MEFSRLHEYVRIVTTLLVDGFVIGATVLVIAIVVMYIVDITQTSHAIRRNYPVVGRFRYLFETLGEFFRQYFFAQDREELPFNRAERSWVYRSAKNIDSTVAFGSTRSLSPPGTVIFSNTAFPTLAGDSVKSEALKIGPYCREPYRPPSIFNISAMSYGAISKPAILALSAGARMAGCWMNTGEGGLSPFHIEGGADIVMQIGTAKYGVRDDKGNLSDDKLLELSAIPQVRMFELKLSQGAKPGKGGMLPGEKVTEEISAIRGIPVGQDSISPNRHPEIDSVDDLLDTIGHIREVTGKPTGFKIVLGDDQFVEELCLAINARGLESAPDFITLDSADGGTGAAPQSLIDYMGLPLRESLPILSNSLIKHNLKRRVRVIASGKLVDPASVAWAICLGADFAVSARGFMFALGCIQALQCNKNTCPTGITTHNRSLQKGLVVEDKAERVKNYCHNMNYEVGVIAHSCGVEEPRRLCRHHARVVTEVGLSISLEELHRLPINAN